MRNRLAAIVTLVIASSAAAQTEESTAPPAAPIQVMVLGTYHFANPGLDLNNMEADDVLTPSRQAELAALADVLATFEPTVVAIERTTEPPYDDPVWLDYDDEMLSTVRNERVQIGYRLADAAGTSRVYAIDEQPGEGEPDYFPYDALSAFAEEEGREDELAALSGWDDFNAAFEAAQATETIPALLARVNGEAFHDDFYWNALTLGEGERQPGPELAAYWFLRNAKIMNKLVQVTEPGDRVVLVFGAGHGHWLREMVEKTRGFELEPVQPYLDRADAAARR